MERNVNINRTKGIGFTGLLTLIFITLKLCGVIAWPWIWVLAPLWIGWGLALVISAIVIVICFIIDRMGY